MKDQKKRKDLALQKRVEAAEIAHQQPHVFHESNGDEVKFQHPHGKKSYLMNFTKGLKHDEVTGLVSEPDHYVQLARAIETGDPWDFDNTPLGPDCIDVGGMLKPDWKSAKAQNLGNPVPVRAWESASAGLTFDTEGPDAQSVTMPPAPKLGSEELDAEMAEVYAQALLRDVPLAYFSPEARVEAGLSAAEVARVNGIFTFLNSLPWFSGNKRTGNRALSIDTGFKGITDGDNVGPYLSQFILAGSYGLGTDSAGTSPEFYPSDGKINFGASIIDQRVRCATPEENHLTSWNEWLDVQNGANLSGREGYKIGTDLRRFITTGRDLATYVHYDALYQAYLNACLILLSYGAKFDPGIPFQGADSLDHQQGFAHYGPPHILTLVTETATRALKAVRYQKFNIHRRCRPEVLAARLEKRVELRLIAPELTEMYNKFDPDLTNEITTFPSGGGNMLLPMAFCEGSPMHPSYGAGHATVAGACVTILKAFFDEDQRIAISSDGKKMQIFSDESELDFNDGKHAFVPDKNGEMLKTVPLTNYLTVGDELNKIAANISIGRNWGGVHFYSDYEQSIYMGEQIAIGMLQEQSIMYNPLENSSMSLTKFDGDKISIKEGKVLGNNIA
ncbi:MAG: vanadium-dependent haloperoxidase [Saprospiraceae bacterium]